MEKFIISMCVCVNLEVEKFPIFHHRCGNFWHSFRASRCISWRCEKIFLNKHRAAALILILAAIDCVCYSHTSQCALSRQIAQFRYEFLFGVCLHNKILCPRAPRFVPLLSSVAHHERGNIYMEMCVCLFVHRLIRHKTNMNAPQWNEMRAREEERESEGE